LQLNVGKATIRHTIAFIFNTKCQPLTRLRETGGGPKLIALIEVILRREQAVSTEIRNCLLNQENEAKIDRIWQEGLA
jgi:hypothetical protein